MSDQPKTEYCKFEESKNSGTWQILNVKPEEEKILKVMIIEGIPTAQDCFTILNTIRNID